MLCSKLIGAYSYQPSYVVYAGSVFQPAQTGTSISATLPIGATPDPGYTRYVFVAFGNVPTSITGTADDNATPTIGGSSALFKVLHESTLEYRFSVQWAGQILQSGTTTTYTKTLPVSSSGCGFHVFSLYTPDIYSVKTANLGSYNSTSFSATCPTPTGGIDVVMAVAIAQNLTAGGTFGGTIGTPTAQTPGDIDSSEIYSAALYETPNASGTVTFSFTGTAANSVLSVLSLSLP